MIALNATLEHAMQPNKYNFKICFVVLSEMNGKYIYIYNSIDKPFRRYFSYSDLCVRNKMTPLMLKKHLTVVENIEKLTRFSEPEVIVAQKIVYNCRSSSIIRNIASITLKRLKVI